MQRSKDELIQASGHVHYEMAMLILTVQRLQSEICDADNGIKNALLESFATHLCNLFHFLYAEEKRPDDILAEHFFEDGGYWATIRPAKPSDLQAYCVRKNKEIGHLTYARLKLTPETKKWPVFELAKIMLGQMLTWANSVDPEYLSQKWTEGDQAFCSFQLDDLEKLLIRFQ